MDKGMSEQDSIQIIFGLAPVQIEQNLFELFHRVGRFTIQTATVLALRRFKGLTQFVPGCSAVLKIV